MKRRSILALLGLGSVGGMAYADSLDGIAFGYENRTPSGKETTPDDAGIVEWEQQFQSELSERPGYGEVSFATDSETIEIEDNAFLSMVSIEPVAGEGDLLRFRAISQSRLNDAVPLISGIFGPSEDISFAVDMDGTSVLFAGGESAIGDFAAAIGTHPDTSEVLVIRASEPNHLEELAVSASE